MLKWFYYFYYYYCSHSKIATQGPRLVSVGITHLVNASMGTKFNQTDTNDEFYKEFNIAFHGIPALDVITCKMLPYLRPAADFIDAALNNGGENRHHVLLCHLLSWAKASLFEKSCGWRIITWGGFLIDL